MWYEHNTVLIKRRLNTIEDFSVYLNVLNKMNLLSFDTNNYNFENIIGAP